MIIFNKKSCQCLKDDTRETLEEVAKNKYGVGYHSVDIRHAFIDGANYQAERMYSEEEVLQLLLRLQQTESYDNLHDWLEQFKKK